MSSKKQKPKMPKWVRDTEALTVALAWHLSRASESVRAADHLMQRHEWSAAALTVLSPLLAKLGDDMGAITTVVEFYGKGFVQMVREAERRITRHKQSTRRRSK